MTQREVSIYGNGAALCSSTAEFFAEALANYKENLAVLDRCGPMVTRFERAADGFIELASLGKEVQGALDTLNGFAEQLNEVLDLFEKLATTTREAVAKGTPPSAPPSSVATQRVRSLPDSQVHGSVPTRTTTVPAGTKVGVVAPVGTKPIESTVRSAPTLLDLQRSSRDSLSFYYAKKQAGIR